MGITGKAARAVVERAIRNGKVSQIALSELASRGYLLYRDFGDHQLVFNAAESMGRRVYHHEHFHRDVTDAVYALADQLHPGGVMLDVGAHIGTQSVYAQVSGRFSRVIAFEPSPGNFRLLSANAAMNAPDGGIEVHRVALSDSAGTAPMKLHPFNFGAYSLEGARDGKSAEGVPTVDVETARGDAFLDRIGVSPEDVSLIWMDVERHEATAMYGLSDVLEARPMLYFEYSYDQPSQAHVDTIDRLVFSAYPHLYLEKRKLVPVTREEMLEASRNRVGQVNVIAADRPLDSQSFERALAEHPQSLVPRG